MVFLANLLEVKEFNFREVVLSFPIPNVPEPELERATGERRGRYIWVAVELVPNSKRAFDWTLIHTIYLDHGVSSIYIYTMGSIYLGLIDLVL